MWVCCCKGKDVNISLWLCFRSAYLLYYYDIYLKVQQELPNHPQSEINKKISESWRLLSVAEKSYYLEKAKLEKEGLDPVSYLSGRSLCRERHFAASLSLCGESFKAALGW